MVFRSKATLEMWQKYGRNESNREKNTRFWHVNPDDNKYSTPQTSIEGPDTIFGGVGDPRRLFVQKNML